MPNLMVMSVPLKAAGQAEERVSRDRTSTTAGAPTPAEIAATDQGRPPAPLGNTRDES
jgi:hypothetical protein